jgi:hypothetical protein
LVPASGPNVSGRQTSYDAVLAEFRPRDVLGAAPFLDLLIATKGPKVSRLFVAKQFLEGKFL